MPRTQTFVIRVRYKKLGGHYHCRIFTGWLDHPGQTDKYLAKSGDLIVGEDEWYNFIDKVHGEFYDETEG